MPVTDAPFPGQDPIAIVRRQGQDGRLVGFTGPRWVEWFTTLTGTVSRSSRNVGSLTRTAQAASIGPTSVPLGQVGTGFYRVTWYARVTQAASTSSSLSITIGWTEGAVPLTVTDGPATGNTPGTVVEGTATVAVDSNSPITFSTTYASSGGVPMLYRVSVIVESVGGG